MLMMFVRLDIVKIDKFKQEKPFIMMDLKLEQEILDMKNLLKDQGNNFHKSYEKFIVTKKLKGIIFTRNLYGEGA